jgi:hypothetical protein
MAEKAPRLGAASAPYQAGDGKSLTQKCRLLRSTVFPKALAAAQTAPDLVPHGAAVEGGLPNIMGTHAPLIRRMMGTLVEKVHALGGMDAFDCPKTSAAVHEAGHCVSHACEGFIPTRAAIWSIRRLGRTQWIGMTYGTPPWRIDDRTSAEADMREARCLMAGVVAEALFEPDFRAGSSLDEVVLAFSVVQSAAVKTGRTPGEQLWVSALADVAFRLKLHEKQYSRLPMS